jgi:hypothetical protein
MMNIYEWFVIGISLCLVVESIFIIIKTIQNNGK